MQVHVPTKTAEGFTGRDLVNRQNCLASALHLIQESFTICRAQPIKDRLSLYTVGTCRQEHKAEWRTLRAMTWYKAHPPPKDAAEPEVIADAEEHSASEVAD
jgi:hypothetical protein